MTLDLLERTDTETTVVTEESADTGKPRHYFHKEKSSEAILSGAPVVALCGWVSPDQFPNFRATGPVCPECQDLYDNFVGSNLPPEERE